jgi:ABC-type branched-subunit amino acid transport system ATPase component
MGALLEIDGLVAGYGQSHILRDLHMRVEAAGITCVVGPNGAGKSTLLRVISGLLRARSGAIRFQGQSIAGLSPRAILDRGIVQVPQERSLFRTMTVLENVRLGGYRLPYRRLVDQRLEAVAELFPIVQERRHELAGGLSGGQQKLVEFARAMMLQPQLLLVDEPSTGLDPRARTLVFETIERLNQIGTTLLLVEQNARSGLKIASHGVVMEGGSVRLTGRGAALLESPEIGRLYLGRSGPASPVPSSRPPPPDPASADRR